MSTPAHTTQLQNATVLRRKHPRRGQASRQGARPKRPRDPLATVGAWAARHRRRVLVGWVLMLVAVTIGSKALGGVYGDTLTIPGSAAQRGLDALKAHDPRAADR